jgi:hypothetical protein
MWDHMHVTYPTTEYGNRRAEKALEGVSLTCRAAHIKMGFPLPLERQVLCRSQMLQLSV